MASTINTKVLGLRELERALQQLPAKLQKNVLRGAMRAGGRVFVVEARQLVPTDHGDLRRSIRTSVRIVNGRVTATVKAGGKGAWYGHLVEFGHWKTHTSFQTKDGRWLSGPKLEVPTWIGPQPFMRPSFDSKAPAAIEAIADYLRKRLTKEGVDVASPAGRLDAPDPAE